MCSRVAALHWDEDDDIQHMFSETRTRAFGVADVRDVVHPLIYSHVTLLGLVDVSCTRCSARIARRRTFSFRGML